jgi:hypothetical protein
MVMATRSPKTAAPLTGAHFTLLRAGHGNRLRCRRNDARLVAPLIGKRYNIAGVSEAAGRGFK